MKTCIQALVLLLSVAVVFAANRRRFKPAKINFFSTQDDITLGKKAAVEANKQFSIITDKKIVAYIQSLGRKLVSHAPGKTEYPWTFSLVNQKAINAVALPGGYIYINRGTVEAARNEAELAGVIAHEICHVVMRHSTNRASKMILVQRLGSGLIDATSSGVLGQVAQLGIGFGFSSVMLKYSRGAETQSDRMATYILYDTGYDPRAMVSFFQTLQQKYSQRTLQFFSSHPSPKNRVKNVMKETLRAGPRKKYRRDSKAFQSVKHRLSSMAF